MGQKTKISYSEKMHVRALGGNFFSGYFQNMLEGKFLKLDPLGIGKKNL